MAVMSAMQADSSSYGAVRVIRLAQGRVDTWIECQEPEEPGSNQHPPKCPSGLLHLSKRLSLNFGLDLQPSPCIQVMKPDLLTLT